MAPNGNIDCGFGNAPLMLALAQISFTQSPEIIQRITEVKAGLARLDLPVAESKQQTRLAVDPATQSPRATQSNFWWFTSIDRRRAVAVAQNYMVLYDANYDSFEGFVDRFRKASQLIETTAGDGCFLQTVALRYVSGFPSDGTPSPYLDNGLRGLPFGSLDTNHFHHEYKFWCETDGSGKLVVSVKTVHGNQLIPQDILSVGLALNPKFSLKKELDAVQLDIHETIQKKTLEKFAIVDIERMLGTMRRNAKMAFLATTTPEAHKVWKIN